MRPVVPAGGFELAPLYNRIAELSLDGQCVVELKPGKGYGLCHLAYALHQKGQNNALIFGIGAMEGPELAELVNRLNGAGILASKPDSLVLLPYSLHALARVFAEASVAAVLTPLPAGELAPEQAVLIALEYWASKVLPGGLIGGSGAELMEVKAALDSFTAANPEYTLAACGLPDCGTAWLLQKKVAAINGVVRVTQPGEEEEPARTRRRGRPSSALEEPAA